MGMAPSGRSATGDGRAHRRTTPGPPYQLPAGTIPGATLAGGVRPRSRLGWFRAGHAPPSTAAGSRRPRDLPAPPGAPHLRPPRGRRPRRLRPGVGLFELRSFGAVLRGRTLPRRLPGPRGAPSRRRSRDGRRTPSTRAATARRRSSGRWPATASREVHFAGASWFLSGNAGVTLAMFTGQGLTAEWLGEWYEASARAASNTREIDPTRPKVGERPGLPARYAERRVGPDDHRLAGPRQRRGLRRDRRRRAGRDDRGGDRGLPEGSLSVVDAGAPFADAGRPGASIAAMSDWARRKRMWEEARLEPALDRAPERQPRFSTISDVEVDRLYGPVVGRRRRGSARADRLPGRAAVHPRHPPDRLSEPPVDDADVRRLRRGRGHERPLPAAAGRRPDRPLDRLRHADPVRLRHRRSRGGGRVRDVRRRRQQPGRHGGPAGRAAARPDQHVDDDQLAGRADLGDVHRGRREARRARGPSWRARSRTTSSRSSWPRRSSSSRPSRRCAW